MACAAPYTDPPVSSSWEQATPPPLLTCLLSHRLPLQPFGVIPALEDGDDTVFESRAICRYLCAAYADKGIDLLGKDVKQRAITENWIEVSV